MRFKIILTTLLLFSVGIFQPTFSVQSLLQTKISNFFSASTDWPMFRHDMQNTGYTDVHINLPMGEVWNFTAGGGLYSSPAVVGGRLYIGSHDAKLYCLNATTGRELWNFSTAQPIWSSPAVANGLVYIASWDSRVYAINAITGKEVWNFTTTTWIESSPKIDGDSLYIGSSDRMYRLNATSGREIWNYTLRRVLYGTVAISSDRIFFGTTQNTLYALYKNGTEDWNLTVGGPIYNSPLLHGGKIIVGVADTLCCFSTKGDFVWRFAARGGIHSSPAIAPYADLVLVGSDDHRLYAVDFKTGEERWNFSTKGEIISSPAVAADKVFFGSKDGNIYCVDVIAGKLLWNATIGWTRSSPAIADSKVFIGTDYWKVHAFSDTIQPTVVATSPSGKDVPVDTSIYVNFSELMNEPSVENAFSIQPFVEGSFKWRVAQLEFKPLENLSYNTTYRVVINASATDRAGNKLANDVEWNFTTTFLLLHCVGGDFQTGVVNTILPYNLTVRVTTGLNKVVAGVPVEWNFVEYPLGATTHRLSDSQTLTNESGECGVVLQLGERTGVYKVSAYPKNMPSLRYIFTAFASPTEPAKIVVEPAQINITADEVAVFNATVYDRFDNILNLSVKWATTCGTITQTGVYYPSKVGEWIVYANISMLFGSAIVIVKIGRLHRIIVLPFELELPVCGSYQFTAEGYDAHDNEFENLKFNWSSDVGFVNETGYFTAGTVAKIGFVNASFGNATGSAKIKLLPLAPAKLIILPRNITLKPNEVIALSVGAYDKYGNRIENIICRWRVEGRVCEIESKGLLKAAVTLSEDFDRDTVIDSEDDAPYDFNNDGIEDAYTNDVDADGKVDFPEGDDKSFTTEVAGEKVQVIIIENKAFYVAKAIATAGKIEAAAEILVEIDEGVLLGFVYHNEKPVVKTVVNIRSSTNAMNYSTFTDAKGRFTAKGLKFGTYKIVIEKPGFEKFAADITIQSYQWRAYVIEVKLVAKSEFSYAIVGAVVGLLGALSIIFFAIHLHRKKQKLSAQLEKSIELEAFKKQEEKKKIVLPAAAETRWRAHAQLRPKLEVEKVETLQPRKEVEEVRIEKAVEGEEVEVEGEEIEKPEKVEEVVKPLDIDLELGLAEEQPVVEKVREGVEVEKKEEIEKKEEVEKKEEKEVKKKLTPEEIDKELGL